MVLAWICGELWHGQAQNGVSLAFQVKFDLEGQGQSPQKTIGTLTKFFCTFCPNLVVLAWTRDDLWRGQARGWRTHTHTDTHTQTDAGNDNTRRPKLASGKNLILRLRDFTRSCGKTSVCKVNRAPKAIVMMVFHFKPFLLNEMTQVVKEPLILWSQNHGCWCPREPRR